jgi:sugar lactone lactonase YvrE
MTVELVLDCRAIIGESLLWVPEEGRLYWADIKAPSLHALHLDSGETAQWRVSAALGGFALDGAGRALVALRSGLHWLNLDDGAQELIMRAPFDPALIRFNESACDSAGRFWIGSMTDPAPGVQTKRTGALYCYTSRDGLRAYPDFAYITNGMAWNQDESVFFLSHSEERVIYKYPYDASRGMLGQRQTFANPQAGPGVPDGAAIDEAGHYWCAMHGAGCLYCYSPEGELAEIVDLPVSQPTKCCFAGEHLEYLYISSARDGLDSKALRREPHAGALFRMKPERPGLRRHWRVV